MAWRVFLAHEGEKEIGEFDSTALMQTEGRECRWNEIFDMRIPLKETNPSTCLVLNLVRRDADNLILAGTTIYLYESLTDSAEDYGGTEDENKNVDYFLRQGHFKLRLWVGLEGGRYPANPRECETVYTPNYEAPYKDLPTVERAS